MPTTLSSLEQWIIARKEEHMLHAKPDALFFTQRTDHLYRLMIAESIINEYIDHLHKTSVITPGGAVPSREVLEHDLPGMHEHSDFMGDYKGGAVS